MYMTPKIDLPALRQYRMNNVQDLMQERNLDALVMLGPDNIRYSTDFRAWLIVEAYDWYGALVTKGGESYVYVPFVDEDVDDPVPELPWIRQYIATPSWVSSATQAEVWARQIKKKLVTHNAKNVGVEGLSPELYILLSQEMPTVKFVPIGRELAMRRQVKHAEEIKLLEASAKLASFGSDAVLKTITKGKTDRELLATATSTMLATGAEFVTHHLCLHREAKEWFANGFELREGDTYVFDIGCYGYCGYGSDMCRTAFAGSPPKAVQDAYRVLMRAHGEGQAAGKAGMKVSELDTIINNAITKSGYPGTPYSMGHGVGLRACELPIIYRPELMASDERLQEGMVICLEPETKVKSEGNLIVKVEDMFLVTATGLRRLTETASVL